MVKRHHEKLRRRAIKVQFTDRLLRNLKPGGKKYLLWDSVQGNFCLVVTRHGTKTFKCVYRHEGRSRWFTIGKFGTIGLSDAREIAKKIIAKSVLGDDPQGQKIKARTDFKKAKLRGETFRDAAELHAKKKKLTNKSWKQAADLITKYVIPDLGDRKIETIKRSDILGIFDRVTESAPVLANAILASTSAIFTWAIKRDLTSVNPCQGIDRNKVKGRSRYLDDTEIKLVWPLFDTLGSTKALILKLILLTGQRPGEVCGMRWQHIKDGVWHQPGLPDGTGWTGTKNKKDHVVPLSEPVLAILEELGRKESGPIFPSKFAGVRIKIPTTKTIWEAADIPRFRPHDLRATVASGMDQLGISEDHISKVLGHHKKTQTQAYIRHDAIEQRRFALTAWSEHVTALVEGRAPAAGVVDFAAARAGRE